jgi:hypothetical protein
MPSGPRAKLTDFALNPHESVNRMQTVDGLLPGSSTDGRSSSVCVNSPAFGGGMFGKRIQAQRGSSSPGFFTESLWRFAQWFRRSALRHKLG